MVDATVLTALNTLITSYFAKKYQLDNVSFTAFSTIISFLLTKIGNYDFTVHLITINFVDKKILIILSVLVVISVLIFLKKYIIDKYNRFTFKQHYKLQLESDRAIEIFNKYTSKYSEMFDVPTSSIISSSNSLRPSDNIVVKFDDKNLNLKGYYVVSMSDVYTFKKDDCSKTSILNNAEKRFVFFVYLQKHETIKTTNYIDIIEKYVSDPVELYSVKTYEYTQNNTRYVASPYYKIYSGNLLSHELIDDLYIKPLFHPKKNELWKQIQYVNDKNNIVSSQMGLILHGPPGTGKSRFAYCMAMATNRHLISVDLLTFQKSRLHNLFKNPEINGKKHTPSDVIFVFDEFDITVMTLHEKELNDKRALISNQKKFDEYEKKLELYFDSLGKSDEKGDPLVPEPVAPSNIFAIDRGSNDQSQTLTVNSLLELIQGPVPLKGAIFIATTNEFEKIQKICPALFRTGRLTPIYFGYAETETLQDISNHYYKTSLNIPENSISTVPTSDILNFVMCNKLTTPNGFEKFQDYVNLHIKNLKCDIPNISNQNNLHQNC